MTFTTLFFDLDDTVYPFSNGLWEAIRNRIEMYMHHHLGIPPKESKALRRYFYEAYGTTLRGLQIHHQIDPGEFLNYVHDLPLEDYLEPDEKLRQILHSLPQPCWIFTNADEKHANRVLDHLGVLDCFSGIIDVIRMGFNCKPNPVAFKSAIKIAGELNPSRCVILDDSPRNLAAAKKLGFRTVHVGRHLTDSFIDLSISGLHAIPFHLPWLWQNESNGHG